MAYKKPQIVAKSAIKQQFVAGCPTKTSISYCTLSNHKCECGQLK